MTKLIFSEISFITAFALLVVLTSCEFDKSGLQPSTGKTNEMLVVTNSDADWNGKMGNTIQSWFGQYQAGLPQPENIYTMAHVAEPNFSKMFKTHHNIFIVDVNPDFEKPVLETKKDLWVKPQRVVKMTVPDKETFFEEFDKHKEAFIELFNKSERRRVNLAFSSIRSMEFKNLLIDKFGIDMAIPKDFHIAVDADNFLWLRREAERFSQGLLFYSYPYTDTIAFSSDHIIGVRDSLTRRYIPGPSDGSYMKVSVIEPPVTKKIDFKGHFAVEMRGLWELEGDFMGGPFLSYTLVDEQTNRVVTIGGFVYNPSQEKKNLARQMEAILHTFSFAEPVEKAEK